MVASSMKVRLRSPSFSSLYGAIIDKPEQFVKNYFT